MSHSRTLGTVLGLAAMLTSCTGTISSGGDGNGSGSGVPFEPVSPAVYVVKVKNIMTGLPATDAEVAAVVADPTALRGLVDTWQATPQFQARLLDFFRNAFQQNQVTLNALAMNIGNTNLTINNNYQARVVRSLMDSFPQTALELVNESRPFTETLTGNRYMLTTAMMSMMSYLDERPTDDTGKTIDRLANAQVLPGFTFDPKSTATLAQTLNPADPNYMIWHDPVTIPATCSTTPAVTLTNLATGDKGSANYRTLFAFIFGTETYTPCYPTGGTTTVPVIPDADFADWHMVTIHPIAATDSTMPKFWDITGEEAATDMSLHIPRVGFSGTLAFAANWGTNITNENRVTANQALIVGIGQSINGENTVASFPVNATVADLASVPACSGCHLQLDPLKQYFRQSYTLSYHDQQDPAQLSQPAGFNIDGQNATGTGVGDLMNTMANHPRFGIAWVQKLQFWANSTAADETDPEVLRISNVFQQSGYDFKTLVRETFSSPLVTYASVTKTTGENGVILSISRRDQYCATLSNRLGLPDVCGMISTAPTSAQTQLANRALLMPVDTYYRAYALPSLPTNPDLFFRQSVEAMCGLIANQVIDVKAPATSRYVSTDPTTAITDFASTVMGLPPSDPRSAPAIQILTNHFMTASATSGIKATDALKSTFTLACIAPSSVIVGL